MARRAFARSGGSGFSTTELMIALAIVAVLVSVAIPAFDKQREKTRVMQAATDIGLMSVAINNYHVENLTLPPSLSSVGYGARKDPWGRPYLYVDLASKKGNGEARKDKKLAPLNSDFDLYSAGKDGESRGPLNAKVSRDDVVRARDGKFVGLASDFDP
jgi:general secretion pathway protein G